jgi:hypothetical protein
MNWVPFVPHPGALETTRQRSFSPSEVKCDRYRCRTQGQVRVILEDRCGQFFDAAIFADSTVQTQAFDLNFQVSPRGRRSAFGKLVDSSKSTLEEHEP